MSKTDHQRQITVRVDEACRMTGIGRTKFYELIEHGEIEVIKVGRMTLVPVSGLEAFVQSHRTCLPGRDG